MNLPRRLLVDSLIVVLVLAGSAGNSAQGKTGSITEEAKRTQFDPGLGVIAG